MVRHSGPSPRRVSSTPTPLSANRERFHRVRRPPGASSRVVDAEESIGVAMCACIGGRRAARTARRGRPMWATAWAGSSAHSSSGSAAAAQRQRQRQTVHVRLAAALGVTSTTDRTMPEAACRVSPLLSQGLHSSAPAGCVTESCPHAMCTRRSRSSVAMWFSRGLTHAGRSPRNKGLRYPADPPKVEDRRRDVRSRRRPTRAAPARTRRDPLVGGPTDLRSALAGRSRP